MIRMETGIDDELDRVVAELLDGFNHLVRELSGARIDHERSLVADLNRDVGAVSDEHIKVALDMQNVDLTIMRIGIHGSAGTGSPRREQSRIGGRISSSTVLHFCKKVRIHRLSTTQRSEQRHLILIGVFVKEWVLSEEIIRDLIHASAHDLFGIVTGIQKSFRIPPGAKHHAGLAHRLGEINRICRYGKMREPVPVPDEMLDDSSFVTLKRAIRPLPAAFDVRCVDGQDVAFEFSRRKSRPGVLRIRRRMWTSIHPDRSKSLADLGVHFDGNEPLRNEVSFFPETVVPRSVIKIRWDVTCTLMLPDRNPRRVPGQSVEAPRII